MTVQRSLIALFILFCMILAQPVQAAVGLEDYGIGNVADTNMSYRHDGAYSAFKYVQVQVQGNGKAICSVGRLNQPDQIEEFNLDPDFVKGLIKLYADLNFFDYDFSKITDSSDEHHTVEDAGTTTFSYQHKDKARVISYESVKIKVRDHAAIPINEDAKKLVELQTMYWKVLNRKIYMDNLKDYKTMDKGVLANELSSLGADARENRIFNSKEFIPLIMEIISQEEYRGSIGQYAASALEEITQEKITGDWWDCQKWLKWWESKKSYYEKD